MLLFNGQDLDLRTLGLDGFPAAGRLSFFCDLPRLAVAAFKRGSGAARVTFTGSGTQGTCNPINLWTTERSLEAELAFPSALSRGAETEFLDPALARGFSKAARAISISQSGLCYFPWRHRAEGLER